MFLACFSLRATAKLTTDRLITVLTIMFQNIDTGMQHLLLFQDAIRQGLF